MRLALGANKRKAHPVDLVERIALHRDWAFERGGKDEITVCVSGKWVDYYVSFTWMDDHEALHLSCSFDVRFPNHAKGELRKLIAEINEKLLIGHFDLWEQSQAVMYRQALVLSGGLHPSNAQVESLLSSALTACEDHYPAFQMVVWSGAKARDALRYSLFETVGTA